MSEKSLVAENEKLAFHIQKVLAGERRFENAAQSVERMILEKGLDKIVKAGRTVYDFRFFREGKKHIIGWFDEINEFVSFVSAAAKRKGEADKMAFVFLGEPGNGKTFFVKYVCDKYRQFLARPENRRYTFRFVNLNRIQVRSIVPVIDPKTGEVIGEEVKQTPKYGNIAEIESQTFEDPMILAMNLFDAKEENIEFLEKAGFKENQIALFLENYRPLGACSGYIWNEICNFCQGDIAKALESFIRIVPVPIGENVSTITGKYSAGDKITSSATELRGEEGLTHVLDLTDKANPYRLDVRKGALARAAGGGIHFADEIFKNKTDLVQVYLGVIQDRIIELEGYRWPIDCLIICTSNNWEYNRFFSEKEQAPLRDRFSTCYVSHNTDYKLQQELSRYAIGAEKKVTVSGDNLHEDPNLDYALSVIVALTRLPHTEQLTQIETMKLEAGETAGEKSVKTLVEIRKILNKSQDVTKRWGQKGIGHRGLGRIVQGMLALPESHEGKCLFARDAFEAAEKEINNSVAEAVDREKFLKDLEIARRLYRQQIKTSIYNAYMVDPDAIRKSVMAYVNMVIGMESDQLGPEKIWRYKDPQNSEKFLTIKIDEKYIEAIEDRMGKKTKEARDSFRTTIRKFYGQKIATNQNYDFMDNTEDLVPAVTEVKLDSDIAGAGSLVGALTNPANEENVRIKNDLINAMIEILNYCSTCAVKSIEYYCEKVDE